MHIHIVNMQIKYLSDNELKKSTKKKSHAYGLSMCHYCTWIVKCHLVVTKKTTKKNNVKTKS